MAPLSLSAGVKKGDTGNGFEEAEQPIVIWPEWNETEVLAEKIQSKHAFEDPEGGIYLPRILKRLMEGVKRAADINPDLTPILVQPLSAMDDQFGTTVGPTKAKIPLLGEITEETVSREDMMTTKATSSVKLAENPVANVNGSTIISETVYESANETTIDPEGPMINIADMDPLTVGTSKLFQVNRYLLQSEFIRSLLSCIHLLYETTKTSKGSLEDFNPWDNIYPKAKDGLPTYNPSGKYMVKLFWLGCWRKIVIDDKIPVDVNGKPLMLCSSVPNELWPMLLCKALLKVANMSYYEDANQSEFGDFDILTALRGWVPERLSIHSEKIKDVGIIMMNLKKMKTRKPSASPVVTPQGQARPTLASVGNSNSNNVKSSINSISMVIRKEIESEKLELNTMSYPYRVMDVIEKTIDGHEEYVFLVRPYFSSCSGKKHQKDDSNEFLDHWVSEKEFTELFKQLIVYHPQSSFRTIKSYSNIYDLTKGNDAVKMPQVLYIPDDPFPANEIQILIMVCTFGRISPNVNSPLSVYVEDFNWKSSVPKESLIRINSNGYSATLLKPFPGRGYKFSVDGTTCYSITLLSMNDYMFDDESKYFTEKCGLKIREFEEVAPPQQPGSWSLLFKHQVAVPEPTFMMANIHVPDSLSHTTILHAINNDTGIPVPLIGLNLYPQLYPASKSGYTFLAENRCTTNRPAMKWKFRLISESIPPVLAEKELISTKMNLLDLSEAYVPNKHNTLYRFVLKIKDAPINNISIQTAFSIPSIFIKLTLYDNDVEIASCQGKGLATIYSVVINQTEEPVPVKSSKDDKKGGPVPVVTPASAPKHRYILQANILHTEIEKLSSISLSGGLDSMRPSSRSSKPGSAAAKKKKAPISGTSPMPTQPATISAQPIPSNTPVANTATSAVTPGFPEVEFNWYLRIISTDAATVTVVRDTEKEDRYRAIKESWEQATPGRMNRAKELRELYMKQVEAGNIQNVNINYNDKGYKPWTIIKNSCPTVLLTSSKQPNHDRLGKLLGPLIPNNSRLKSPSMVQFNSRSSTQVLESDEAPGMVNFSVKGKILEETIKEAPTILQSTDFEARTKLRIQNIEHHTEIHGELVKSRLGDKEKRANIKKLFIEMIDRKLQEIDGWQKVDNEKREQYRHRITIEAEEASAKLKAALDAAADFLAREQAAGEESTDKKKKVVKK
ncbi:hypothetical protein BC833DRAFT_651992 [Globomyces pollinis-pini]|nr:hypothetical protein BC833DRAFT_651992 [Globomyces pollinis-pini]